jgi:hypothetical protein
MATNNQRLTAYINIENWQRLQEYAIQQGFCDDNGKVNQSPLVNAILNSFFSGETPNVTLIDDSDVLSNTLMLSGDTLKDVKAELRTEVIGEVKDEISKKLTA